MKRLIAGICIITNIFAAGQASDQGPTFAIGMNMDYASDNDWAAMIRLKHSNMFGELGFNHERHEPASGSKFHLTEVRAKVGAIRPQSEHYSVVYGLGGSYGLRSEQTARRVDPLSLGVFVGAQVNMHDKVTLDVGVYPYIFERQSNRIESQNFIVARYVSLFIDL